MSDFRVAVRRTNEWDGPSMLKIYTPYVEKTHYTPDTEVPTLAEYVQRIDTYTYGRMWILTEINHQTAGFCFLTDRDIPKDDLFSADAQLYVSEKCLHSGVGTSLYSLMLDIMHHANYRRVTAHINLPNDAAVAFHKKMGIAPAVPHKLQFLLCHCLHRSCCRDVKHQLLLLRNKFHPLLFVNLNQKFLQILLTAPDC